MVFDTTSTILQLYLGCQFHWVEEIGENNRLAARQILSHNAISSTLYHERNSNSQLY